MEKGPPADPEKTSFQSRPWLREKLTRTMPPSPIEPDTVKIDAGWFRAAARNPESSALLPDLFAGFRGLGCQVLVEGIETSADLAAALAAGADFLQGYYLARPALAGTIFDDTPLGIGVLLDENVQRVAANSR